MRLTLLSAAVALIGMAGVASADCLTVEGPGVAAPDIVVLAAVDTDDPNLIGETVVAAVVHSFDNLAPLPADAISDTVLAIATEAQLPDISTDVIGSPTVVASLMTSPDDPNAVSVDVLHALLVVSFSDVQNGTAGDGLIQIPTNRVVV